MAPSLMSLFGRLTTKSSAPSEGFVTVPKERDLFHVTNEKEDGPECLLDCSTCTIKYPSKFKIDEDEALYGHVKGWSTHLVVGTGKSDWVRDVADEKGSIMEAVDKGGVVPTNGVSKTRTPSPCAFILTFGGFQKMKLSASDMPVPDNDDETVPDNEAPAPVLLLPAFMIVDNVTAATVPDLIANFVNVGPTNTTPLDQTPVPILPPDSPLKARPCPHDYLILMCSQKTRDARCGQSAPLLRREFERHLRPLGLYRDLHDERPGGVGIYFISHLGGHKFSANMMIYRRAGIPPETVRQRRASFIQEQSKQTASNGVSAGAGVDGEGREEALQAKAPREAAQCIWLARVRPEDCENIVRYTILQGKVVKPERQLRGGFDRCKQFTSW